MQGLKEARELYLNHGAEMIHRLFPEYEGRIAVGLAGHGSECFGFDDEQSRDHDFPIGFCLWLDDETDREIGVELSRAYRSLPIKSAEARSAMAESNRGVCRISDFYRRYTGAPGAPEELLHWLSLPSYALAEATNGEVWRDDLGLFTAIREKLLHAMPEDVRLKKLAARAIEMAQTGQYNYPRMIKRGEYGAAMLCLSRFVNAACEGIYLLNRRHMPYYKWQLRAMEGLEKMAYMKEALEFLLTAENDAEGSKLKELVIEDICKEFIINLKRQRLSDGGWDYLEPHAFEIIKRIENRELRAMHIAEG
ncbi:MAG: DUF4037 domain-containing protein [Oscillospiraceae bacterium]|nr:DUF4037 domain-containing protein [Oscillospiraceae bacterium]